jgi:hypothetical protein
LSDAYSYQACGCSIVCPDIITVRTAKTRKEK